MNINLYGFIITRHVNSEKTNNYWNRCIKLIITFYPHRKIVVIDDNSNQDFVKAEFEYKNLPNFPHSTAPGHQGRLICGSLEGVPIVAMDGRFHAYEGYDLATITLPVRVFKMLGCEFLFVSNACGGMNPLFSKGDICWLVVVALFCFVFFLMLKC